MFQSDWDEGDVFSPAFVRNKPDIVDAADVEGLKLDVKSLRSMPAYMVNDVRGCVDLHMLERTLYFTGPVALFVRDSTGVMRSFTLSQSDVPWIRGDGPESDMYFVYVDMMNQSPPGGNPVYVVSKNSTVMPAMENPIIVGVFSVFGGKIQGISFCNDDVKVDGRYIYDNPIRGFSEATLVCRVRGGMNIDTAGKVITLGHDAHVFTDDGWFVIPWGSYAWRASDTVNYQGTYVVYAVMNKDDPSKNSLAIILSVLPFVAPEASVAYRVGAFVWTEDGVEGISFANDVKVDGAYIYGGSGGGLPAYVNLLEGMVYIPQSQVDEYDGSVTFSASMYSNTTGNIPIEGGAKYVLDGVAQATNVGEQNKYRFRMAYYNSAGNALKPILPDGTTASLYYITIEEDVHYMEILAPGAAIRCVIQASHYPGKAPNIPMWMAVDNDITKLKFYRKP
jgi:hypothetical protein